MNRYVVRLGLSGWMVDADSPSDAISVWRRMVPDRSTVDERAVWMVDDSELSVSAWVPPSAEPHEQLAFPIER